MKRLIIILAFISFLMDLSAQVYQFEREQYFIQTDTLGVSLINNPFQIQSNQVPIVSRSILCFENKFDQNQVRNIKSQNSVSLNNPRNLRVSRNPEQVLITKDDQFAFIRCFLSNTIEIIKIPEFEIVKSLTIPSPKYCTLSRDGSKLYVTSFTEFMFPPEPPDDDCSMFAVWGSGKSILTTIDVLTKEIICIDTLKIDFIRKILQPTNDSILYLIGNDVIEYNLLSEQICRRWTLTQQILNSEIDAKNDKIFIAAIDPIEDSLHIINLTTSEVIKLPYYYNGDNALAYFIGIDTLSDRVFIQGRTQPDIEVLVFDAISLEQLNPIDNASLFYGSFIICPDLGSIYMGGGYPNMNSIELDYITLSFKNTLPSQPTQFWKTIDYNDKMKRLYSFTNGDGGDILALINPPEKLDLVEFDISTGQINYYETTDFEFGCSYGRSLALTRDGRYVMVTNSPDNSISILELSPANVTDIDISDLVNFYPNPTHNIIEITLKSVLESDYNIEIYNLVGQLSMKIPMSKFETRYSIDLTAYPKGQYFIHINSINQSFAGKIIKL